MTQVEAIQAALEIQANVGDLAFEKDARLSVKIGFGMGKVKIIQVGGVEQRVEYLPVGAPLSQAFEAEHLAEGGGVIIIPAAINAIIEHSFETEMIPGEKSTASPNGPFYYVKKQTSNQIMVKAAAQLLRASLERSELLLLKDCVMSYIFPGLMPYVEFDNEGWFSNLGEISTLFASIGVDLSSLNDRKGLTKFNEVIRVIQKCIYQTGGSLNKLLMDDKGTTMIAIWNAHNHYTQEACARAVACGKRFLVELAKQDVGISVGIATGKVFAGVVGASGGRREYSILGDGVNLSARLMQAASKSKENKIYLDETTALKSSNRLQTVFNESILVKGKSMPIPTYFPTYPDKHFEALLKRKASREEVEKNPSLIFDSPDNLLVNSFTFTSDYGQKLAKKADLQPKSPLPKTVLSSQQAAIKKIKDRLTRQFASEEQTSTFILVRGKSSCGKSHILKAALQELSAEMASAPFYLISFAVEPHQYNERLDALISLYSKLIVYQRILQSNFSGDEKEVVLAALAKYSPERGQTEVARKLPQLLALISEWSMNDINFNPTMKNIISNDMLEACYQVFEALLKSVSGSGQKGPPLVLLLNSGQFAGKNPLKILSQLTKALKLTLIVEYSTEYAEFKSAVGPEELVAMFKDERVSSENLSIGNLSLEEGKKLCNQYCSYMFGLDIPMNPDLSQYLALKGKTNPSGILSLVRLFLDKGFIEFELNAKRLDVSEKFIQTGDESWGETYLLAPMAFIRQNCYLLNELTPVDSCVPSADPGPEHGGDPRRDIRRHTDQPHQLFPSARD